MIFINLKTYENGTGLKAKAFIHEAEILFNELNVPLTILVQVADLWLLTPATKLPLWVQHVDNIDYGKNTGWILPQAVIEAGAQGTMLNHAVHKMFVNDIREIIQKYQTETFKIMASSLSPEEVFQLDDENPTYISYEPSVYIGTKTSIIDVSPNLISAITAKLKTPLVLGAGIHTPEHIIKGVKLGAKGFMISSDILLAENPIQRLREYMLAYRAALQS